MPFSAEGKWVQRAQRNTDLYLLSFLIMGKRFA